MILNDLTSLWTRYVLRRQPDEEAATPHAQTEEKARTPEFSIKPDYFEERGKRPSQLVDEFIGKLSHDDQMEQFCGIVGLSNVAANSRGHRETIVQRLVELTRSLNSNTAEAAAQALYHLTVSAGHCTDYIAEAIVGLNIFCEEVDETIDFSRHFNPDIKRWLAAAVTSAALYDVAIAQHILPDLVNCFDIPEEDLHCHVASELYQIADAHGFIMSHDIVKILYAQAKDTPFERLRIEIGQHLENITNKHPQLKNLDHGDNFGLAM